MSTGRIDPSKMASHLARLLIVRHFAERGAERSGAHFLSFQRFLDGEPVAFFSGVGRRRGGER